MMQTKACDLTEGEVKSLITYYGYNLIKENNFDECIERINYLHKRLKSFKDDPEFK